MRARTGFKTMGNGRPEPRCARQNANGSLYELSRKSHLKTKSGQGREAVHPYGNQPHPDFPVNRALFKKEVPQYWMDRAQEGMK